MEPPTHLVTAAESSQSHAHPANLRSWVRWTAAWIAANGLLWSLAHVPDSCDGMPFRVIIGFVAVTADVCLYVWLLVVLPTRSARVVAIIYPVILGLIVVAAFRSTVTGSCPIYD